MTYTRTADGSPAAGRARRMALLGVGYMGGSLALALRAAGAVEQIVGYDRDPAAAAAGVRAGVLDAAVGLPEEAVPDAELVVLAAPVRALGALAAAIAPRLEPDALVLDLGSVKGPVAEQVAGALGDARFVACHPLAGAEKSGVAAADAALYQGRPCVLCPRPDTPAPALARAEALWRAAGAQVARMDLQHHDAWVAALSHLPHAVAFALARTVGGEDAAAEALRAVLPGGTLTSSLRDTTRVAASSPEVWRDIFLMNAPALLPLIDRFAGDLAHLRDAIARADDRALGRWLDEARSGRRRLFED